MWANCRRVEDRGDRLAAVHGVTKSQTGLSNWRTTTAIDRGSMSEAEGTASTNIWQYRQKETSTYIEREQHIAQYYWWVGVGRNRSFWRITSSLSFTPSMPHQSSLPIGLFLPLHPLLWLEPLHVRPGPTFVSWLVFLSPTGILPVPPPASPGKPKHSAWTWLHLQTSLDKPSRSLLCFLLSFLN